MNEIKVGQWARANFIDIDGTRVASIGRVVECQEDIGIYFIETSETTYSLFKEDFKTADNLVDLLEYDDIVNLVNLNRNDEIQWIIENETLMDVLIRMIINKGYEITAIELAENRVKQVICRLMRDNKF